MGPRRFRRGCGIASDGPRIGMYGASMGPRRFRRGCRATEPAGGGPPDELQWGRDVSVADVETTMLALHVPTELASMGPRRFRRGCKWRTSAIPRKAELQWGRDVSVADVARSRNSPNARTAASMGPRRFRRGCIGPTRLKRPSFHWLQWGRDVSVADVARYAVLRATMTALQWGRDVSVADVLLVAASCPSGSTASMGPRRFRRGCDNSRTPGTCHCCKLQWGRDVSVADVQRRDVLDLGHECASMGPRRFRRGCDEPALEPAHPAGASMGPRRFRRGC